jgi:UPF0271 protein
MTKRIDLNSDLGESFGPWEMGDDTSMLSIVNSANIACGGHASDPETMFKTLVLATRHGVNIGAHPGYNDPIGFGRRIIPMPTVEIGRMVTAQIGALVALAALVPTRVRYVKPHGALGNLAAADAEVAQEIVKVVKMIDPKMAILAISGNALETAAKDAGVEVYSEIFADRGYLTSGQLVPRGQEGAMIHDPKEATDRLLSFLETGLMPTVDGEPIPLAAHSICVHGDGPTAVNMARFIQQELHASGVELTSFLS